MISLTIMALVLVLVFGAFRIGSRAWEKGEKDVENPPKGTDRPGSAKTTDCIRLPPADQV